MANYVIVLRKELLQLSRVCGVVHPGLLRAEQCEILDSNYQSRPLKDVFALDDNPDWGLPSSVDREETAKIMGRA